MTPSGLIAGVVAVVAVGAMGTPAAMAGLRSVPERTSVVDGDVQAVASIGNTVFIGGRFSSVGPRTGPGVALSRSGRQPRPDSTEFGAGSVAAVVEDGAGGWYAGGRFATVGGLARGNLAHILANGRVDRRFDPGTDGEVTALAISGRTLYIGGSFQHVGAAPRPFLAALALPDGRVTRWRPRPGAIDRHLDDQGCAERGAQAIAALTVSERTVYVGGSFNSIGAHRRHRLAAVDARTGRATTWDPGADGAVCTLAASGSTIYAGGDFRRADHARRNRVAAWNASSGRLTAWNPNADGGVAALSVSGRSIYAGGGFTAIGRAARDGLAALHAATGTATNWNPQPDAGSSIYAVAVKGHTVYAGGEFFTRIGGQQRHNLAALDAVTGLATRWKPTPDGPIQALGPSGAKVFAGGGFASIGVKVRPNLAALDAATGAVTNWNPGAVGLPSEVDALIASGSTVYVGGYFRSVGGQMRSNIAAVDATTGAATDWNPGGAGTVRALAMSASTIYVGGDFGSIGGRPRDHLAAVDASTGAVTDWNPDVQRGSLGASVDALVVVGPIVYTGGSFTSVGGQQRTNLAAIDATTGAATQWNPDAEGGATAYVGALAVAGATVYAGGSFTSVGGQQRTNLAAIEATTGTATGWNPNPDDGIRAVAASDSTVVVGGGFTSIGGKPRTGLATLDAVTGAATDWNPDVGAGGVDALEVSGPTLFAGGSFSSVGPVAQRSFAEFITR